MLYKLKKIIINKENSSTVIMNRINSAGNLKLCRGCSFDSAFKCCMILLYRGDLIQSPINRLVDVCSENGNFDDCGIYFYQVVSYVKKEIQDN